jgi:hypothetical protein
VASAAKALTKAHSSSTALAAAHGRYAPHHLLPLIPKAGVIGIACRACSTPHLMDDVPGSDQLSEEGAKVLHHHVHQLSKESLLATKHLWAGAAGAVMCWAA